MRRDRLSLVPLLLALVLYFDHSLADRADTLSYELCVDGIALCQSIDVQPIDDLVLTFVLPAWVPKGQHLVAVRAVGVEGTSALSNAIDVRVAGVPGPPVRLRKDAVP